MSFMLRYEECITSGIERHWNSKLYMADARQNPCQSSHLESYEMGAQSSRFRRVLQFMAALQYGDVGCAELNRNEVDLVRCCLELA